MLRQPLIGCVIGLLCLFGAQAQQQSDEGEEKPGDIQAAIGYKINQRARKTEDPNVFQGAPAAFSVILPRHLALTVFKDIFLTERSSKFASAGWTRRHGHSDPSSID